MMKVIGGTGEYFGDQSFMTGIGNLIRSAQGDPRAQTEAVLNAPKQMVPLGSLLRWVTQLTDDVYRKTDKELSLQSIRESIQKDLPFLSRKLPAYTNIDGTPAKRPYPILSGFLPWNMSKMDPQGEKIFQMYGDIQKIRETSREETDKKAEMAQELYSKIKTMDVGTAANELRKIAEDDPELFSSLVKIGENVNKPFEIEMIRGLGVENGDRAKYINKLIEESGDREELVPFIKELIKNKVITDKVQKQLQILRQQ